MPLFRPTPPKTLSTWLDVATRGLVPSAQNRIRTEIENHYNESVQNRLVTGASEADAHVSALADLGNPRAAAKRFQKEHLTFKEATSISLLLKSSARGQVTAIVCIYVLAMFFSSTAFGIFLSFCFFFALDAPAVSYFSKPITNFTEIDPPSPRVLRFLRIRYQGNFILSFLSLVLVASYYRAHWEKTTMMLLPSLACLISGLELLRLHNKLQLLNQNHSPARSPDAMAS